MRIVGDYLSYHNLYDECYEDGLFCWYFRIVFCWSIEYQIQGMDNDKRLGENEISLCVSHTLPLPLPLSLSACLYVFLHI